MTAVLFVRFGANLKLFLLNELWQLNYENNSWIVYRIIKFNIFHGYVWRQHSLSFKNAKFYATKKLQIQYHKNALFWYFWAVILKSYCKIWNQHPRIHQNKKNLCKNKIH